MKGLRGRRRPYGTSLADPLQMFLNGETGALVRFGEAPPGKRGGHDAQ